MLNDAAGNIEITATGGAIDASCTAAAAAAAESGTAVVMPRATAAAKAADAGGCLGFGTKGDENKPCVSNSVAFSVNGCAGFSAGAGEGSVEETAATGYESRLDCGVLAGVLSGVQNSELMLLRDVSFAAKVGAAIDRAGGDGFGPSGMRHWRWSTLDFATAPNKRAAALSVNGLAADDEAAAAAAGSAVVAGAVAFVGFSPTSAAAAAVEPSRLPGIIDDADPAEDRKAANAWLFAGTLARSFAACASAAMLLYNALASSAFLSVAVFAAATLLAVCTDDKDDVVVATVATTLAGCCDGVALR